MAQFPKFKIGGPSYVAFSEDELAVLENMNFQFNRVIGLGSISELWSVNKLNQTGDAPIFCKKICIPRKAIEETNSSIIDSVNRIKNDLQVYRQLNHPNLVISSLIYRSYEKDQNSGHPIIVLAMMEMCDGNLQHIFENRVPLTQRDILVWLAPVVHALQYLHDQKVAHLDLKPQNILFMKISAHGYIFKVSDSEMAKIFDNMNQNVVYQAPEVQNASGDLNNPQLADIYSVGVMVIQSMVTEIRFWDWAESDKNEDLTFDLVEDWYRSKNLVDLVVNMVELFPNARFSIKDVAEHQFVSSVHYHPGTPLHMQVRPPVPESPVPRR